jgi:protease II
VRQVKVLKQQDVPNYDASLYETRRVHCTARDGKQVPSSYTPWG